MITTELSFLERAGCFVAAKEETDLQIMLDKATDAANFANKWPLPRNIDKAVELQCRYIDEVDRIRIWSPDPEQMFADEFRKPRSKPKLLTTGR